MKFEVQEELRARGLDRLDDARAAPGEELKADFVKGHGGTEALDKRKRAILVWHIEGHDKGIFHVVQNLNPGFRIMKYEL
jgi:hypothetical protein